MKIKQTRLGWRLIKSWGSAWSILSLGRLEKCVCKDNNIQMCWAAKNQFSIAMHQCKTKRETVKWVMLRNNTNTKTIQIQIQLMKQSNEWQCGSFFGICLFLPHSSFSLFSSFSTIGITVRWETKSWPYSPVHNMIFSQEPRDALPWKFNILCRWLWKRAVRDSWRHHTLLQVMQLDQETWRRYLAFWTGETNFYISLASLYVGKVFLKQGCGKKCGHQAQQEEDRMQVNFKKYL